MLKKDTQQINQITSYLLHEYFPPTIHEDILDAIGMPWTVTVQRAKRDPKFREEILRLYERKCAFCGFDGRLGRNDLGVEAAHVRMHAYDGPDAPQNGMALCTLHHKMFDFGAMGLTEDYRILVSSHVTGGEQVEKFITCHAGQLIREPQDVSMKVNPIHIHWHKKEVFKGPERPF